MKSNDRLAGRKTLHVSGLLEEIAVEEVKARIDLVALFGRYGVELKAQGKSFVGRCPWHEDHTPSLSVDREKGLYHCFGCGESGDAVSLTEKMLNVGFKEAVAELRSQGGSGASTAVRGANGAAKKNSEEHTQAISSPPTPRRTDPSAEASDARSAEEHPNGTALGLPQGGPTVSLDAVAAHYEKQLARSAQGCAYLEQRGLTSRELWTRFRLGLCDGSLRPLLSAKQVEELTAAGILTSSGAEHLAGCLTVPLFDASGGVVGFYGRAVDDRATPKHRYLSGPHRGLVNRGAARVYREKLLLTESVLDALSLIQLKVENVIPCYGVNGFTEEHRRLLLDERVASVAVAFDADEAGRKGSAKLVENLRSLGLAAGELFPPEGKDWNDYLRSGGSKEALTSLFAELSMRAGDEAETSEHLEASHEAGRLLVRIADRRYRIVGARELFVASLRVNVRAETDEAKYIDNVDLYSARSRTGYASAFAALSGLEARVVERDLIRILDHLEAERERSLTGSEEQKHEMSEEERASGMQLLTDADLFERIIEDTERLGYVGEEVNKLLVYLAATSRTMADPLSVLVLSESAAGKSYLIETVKRLMPAEDVVSMTSLSDQALNYLSEDGLLHKFLVMGEAVHSEAVEHQVREMLSEHELVRLVTLKDPKSGELSTRTVRKKVVVSCVMSTTNAHVNPENVSRFFVVNADESREQTARIHEVQRRKYSVERYREMSEELPKIIAAHHAAQRLLAGRLIVNPFAPLLSFPDALMRTRRDHERFLDLIAAVCFLRQFQKEERVKAGGAGEELRYIECDLADYRVAHRIMSGILGSTLSGVPAATVMLYEQIRTLAREKARSNNLEPHEVRFTQRALREASGLSATSVKRALRLLTEYEYLSEEGVRSRGSRRGYRLLADEPLSLLDRTTLPTPEQMAADLQKLESGPTGSDWAKSGPGPLLGG